LLGIPKLVPEAEWGGFHRIEKVGLFFIAYQRDPRTQFVPLQQRLAADVLNEYIQHVGSALFAIPPVSLRLSNHFSGRRYSGGS